MNTVEADPPDQYQEQLLEALRWKAALYAVVVQAASGKVLSSALPLRPGHTARLVLPPTAIPGAPSQSTSHVESYWGPEFDGWLIGGMNVHLPLEWDDGVQWLARIRQQATDIDNTHRLCLDFANTSIAHSIAPDLVPAARMPVNVNPTLDYFFVDRLPGSARVPSTEAMGDLADFLIQLSLTPFEAVGSFVKDGPSFVVGPLSCAGDDLEYPSGPFQTSQERYLSRVSHRLTRLEAGADAGLGDCLGQSALEAYLVLLEVRSLILSWPELSQAQPTYLRHTDDRGDHFLCDGDHLTGVIDWEFAETLPLIEAFATPFGLIDRERYNAGDNGLSEKEQALITEYERRGRYDLADAAQASRRFHRLRDILGLGPGSIRRHPATADELWALRCAIVGEDVSGPRTDSMEMWTDLALVRYGEDPGLKQFQLSLALAA